MQTESWSVPETLFVKTILVNCDSGAPNTVSSLCLLTHARSPALPVAGNTTTEKKKISLITKRYFVFIFIIIAQNTVSKYLIFWSSQSFWFQILTVKSCFLWFFFWFVECSPVLMWVKKKHPHSLYSLICTPSLCLPYVPYLRPNPFSLVSSKNFVLCENSS